MGDFLSHAARHTRSIPNFVYDASEKAVVYWVANDNVVMGTLASTASRENLSGTLGKLAAGTGISSGVYFFISGKAVTAAALANFSVFTGLSADLLSSNDYVWHKLAVEALSRGVLPFGPADDLGQRIHQGINQLSTTAVGGMVGADGE